MLSTVWQASINLSPRPVDWSAALLRANGATVAAIVWSSSFEDAAISCPWLVFSSNSLLGAAQRAESFMRLFEPGEIERILSFARMQTKKYAG